MTNFDETLKNDELNGHESGQDEFHDFTAFGAGCYVRDEASMFF